MFREMAKMIKTVFYLAGAAIIITAAIALAGVV